MTTAKGKHRLRKGPTGRQIGAAVLAAGALTATAVGVSHAELAPRPSSMAMRLGTSIAAPAPAATTPDGRIEAEKLSHAEAVRVAHERAEQERQAAEQAATERAAAEAAAQAAAKAAQAAQAPRFVRPAQGTFTSGFGARWGATHFGVDIANAIGTPILSVAAGTVVEAGPASGFGLWVRVQHDDGTITVYGHVNEIMASTGQRVAAGEQIATMGNRGNSTGPHLHFEVWQNGGTKIDPLPWLQARGISLG